MTCLSMNVSWERCWSRETNQPRTIIQGNGILFVLRDRGWVSIPPTGIPETYGLFGPTLQYLLAAKNGTLWGLDKRGAILRHDGTHFQEVNTPLMPGSNVTGRLCQLLLAMEQDGGASFSHGHPYIDVLDRNAIVRCSPGRANVLWRGSDDVLVRYQDGVAVLGKLLDGGSFRPVAVGTLSDGHAIVVDGSGAIIAVAPSGQAECRSGGYVFRTFRHTYPDPEPDEYQYPVQAAAIGHDGSVWRARPGMGIEHLTCDGNHLGWLESKKHISVDTLGVAIDGSLWGTSISSRYDAKGSGGGCLQALAGPHVGQRVTFEPPLIKGAVGLNAWLIEEEHQHAFVRLEESGTVFERIGSSSLDTQAVLSSRWAKCVIVDDICWEAQGARLCVRVDGNLIPVAEARARIVGLDLEGGSIWVMTKTSVARWNGAALVDMGGPGANLRDVFVQQGRLLALTEEEAFTARAAPVDPAISLEKPQDVAVLSRLLQRAVCSLHVAVKPVESPNSDADALAKALGVPELRGTWQKAVAPVAGAAIDRLWAGERDIPGIDDPLRVRAAGCLARASEGHGQWYVCTNRTVVRGVMLEARGVGLATWRSR